MNDLDLIRDLGTELDPTPTRPPARMRARFVAAIRYPRRAAGLRRRVPWLVAAAGTAAVVTFAATQVWNPAVSDPQSDQSVVEMNGRQVLLAAASSARAQGGQAPDPDAFIYTRLKQIVRNLENGQDTHLDTELWWPVGGAGGALFSYSESRGNLTALTCNVESAIQDLPGPVIDPDPTAEQVAACATDPGYVTGLPNDPDAMLTYLTEQPRPAVPGDPQFATVFSNAWELLKWRMVAPEAQATIFEVLAGVPRLEVRRDVETVSDKIGTAVTFSPTRRADFELIFDSRTHDLIGSRQTWFETTGDGAERVVAWTEASAVMERAIVPEMRLRPDGSRNRRRMRNVMYGDLYGLRPVAE